MSKNLKTEAVDHLFDAILCLKDRAECYTFFEDVCTVNELFSLSQTTATMDMIWFFHAWRMALTKRISLS